MRSSPYRVATAIVAAALLTAGCTAPPQQDPLVLVEIATLELDGYGLGGIPTIPGPVLEDGVDHVIEVEGTFSVWDFSAIDPGWRKGTPGESPLFPSPGRTNGFVTFAANGMFAVQVAHPRCDDDGEVPYPSEVLTISLDGGATFAHVPPTSSATDANHVDTYEVAGTGQPSSFRLGDVEATDNYGVLRIKISSYQ